MARGKIIVISGPSGAGKTTICREMGANPRFRIPVTATTRPPRENEKDGIDYHFLTKEQFENKIASGELLEYAKILGHYYGSLRKPVEEAVSSGQTCLLNIDIQGAETLRKKGLDATFVFLVPPDMDTLRSRLEDRGTENSASVGKRLKLARAEMQKKGQYDYIVVNDTIARAVQEIKDIVFSESKSSQ